MKPLHIWIKSIIDSSRDLSQKGLAQAMGLNPAAVNRMLHGARKIKVDEVAVIEKYLGQSYQNPTRPPLAPQSEIYGSAGLVSEAQNTSMAGPVRTGEPVPVYGRQDEDIDMELDLEGDTPVDWVIRHPAQTGIKNAFAVYVFSDDMKPRYFPGELVYIHPGRPPETGRDCLIKMKSGQAHLRRYIDRNGNSLHMRQFNPPQDDILHVDDIEEIYSVIGRG